MKGSPSLEAVAVVKWGHHSSRTPKCIHRHMFAWSQEAPQEEGRPDTCSTPSFHVSPIRPRPNPELKLRLH